MKLQLIAKDKELVRFFDKKVIDSAPTLALYLDFCVFSMNFRSSYKNWPRLVSTPDPYNFLQTFDIFKIDFRRAQKWPQNLSNAS